MSKEFQGLDIPRMSRDTTRVEHWLPNIYHKDTDRPITKLFLGLVGGDGGRYYPLEIDLLKQTQNNIMIVGNEASKKEELLKGAMTYVGERTAVGYMTAQILAGHTDPYKITELVWLKRHLGKNDIARAPEGIMAKYILAETKKALESKKPILGIGKDDYLRFLVIDDLGNFLRRARPEYIAILKDILNYKGWQPFMTIALVNDHDVPLLKDHGLGPDNVSSGLWFLGQSEAPDNNLEDLPPGEFVQWDPKRKRNRGYRMTYFT